MRIAFASLVVMLSASGAFAQTHPQQHEQTLQQLSGNYYGERQYIPQSAYAAPAPQPVQQPQPHYQQPQPGDYGRSVMSDIRQMNF